MRKTSDEIRERIEAAGARYWAGDNISEYLNDGDKKRLIDELTEKFEGVLDSLDLYAFKNWDKGEVLEGPNVSRHFIEVTLMYPHKQMPDPDGPLLGSQNSMVNQF